MSPGPLPDVEVAAAQLRAGRVSSRALTEAAIARAKELDGRLGAYVERFDEDALAAAEAADSELAAGTDRGPLHGVPVAVKDLLATSEAPTRAGSQAFDPDEIGRADAAAVAALRRAGAILLAKTTTMEFAVGQANPDDPFPLPRDPWDLARWPGGSSSGTAVAVAAGLVPAGLGTDTLGSIRIPACFCGVTGLMPTLGLVDGAGCVPLAPSLDRIGPIARSARGCRALLGATAPRDGDLGSEAGDGDLRGVRVGVERRAGWAPGPLHDEALRPAFEAAMTILERAGATLKEVQVPLYDDAVEAGWTTMQAESFELHRDRLAARGHLYGPDARAILSAGSALDRVAIVEAGRVRSESRRSLASLMADVDLIATPTTSCVAPTYASLEGEGMTPVLAALNTMYWNLVGLPALALPIGFNAEGLPLSLQLAGRTREEELLLRAGEAFQQLTDWHLATPPAVP